MLEPDAKVGYRIASSVGPDSIFRGSFVKKRIWKWVADFGGLNKEEHGYANKGHDGA